MHVFSKSAVNTIKIYVIFAKIILCIGTSNIKADIKNHIINFNNILGIKYSIV